MTSTEDTSMEDQTAAGQKKKLIAQSSFDDDMDFEGFSELDKLDPVDATQQSQPHPPPAQAPPTQPASVPTTSNANLLHNGPLVNGVSSLPTHNHQQQPTPQIHTHQGPSSAGQTPSVLHELLFTQSSASTSNNSPRQQHQPVYSSANFPNKSPMPPHSMAAPPQNMSPMGMVPPQRLPTAQQQVRQTLPGHTGFDPNMSSQASQMPPGNMQGPPMMSGSQVATYQQHPRPNMYAPNQPVRMPQNGVMPPHQSGIRQPGFANNLSQNAQPQGATNKNVRQPQTPHPALMMPGGAPTPPQSSRPMMIGQPGVSMSSQNAAPFDVNHPPYQQIVSSGPVGGQGSQPRQPPAMSENGYMMQGQILPPGQQLPPYMGQMPHRMMSFGPNGTQMMTGAGQMDSAMMGPGPSQPQPPPIGQLPPGVTQQGVMMNGTQMMPGPRHNGPSAPNAQIASQNLIVPQSPGLMMNGPNPQIRGQSGPSGIGPPSQQIMGGQQQDPEKRKLIQQQLVLLLHAHKCQQREKQEPPQNRTQCTLPYCNVMKGVLEHMVNCNFGRQCQFAHCASSRQIITHWKNCNKEDCPVCNPVKKYAVQPGSTDRRPGERDILQPPSVQPAMQPNQMPPSIGNLNNMFGSPPPAASVNNLLEGYNPNINPFRQGNPPNKPGQGVQQQQMAGFGPSNEVMPPPEPPSQVKDWHQSITPDLRNHLVGKLVKAIFPSPDPAAIHDQRIKDLITYARKVEKDMFEAAPDKEAYYHMLAEKIYKIQKELQEKKNRRLNEQQQRPLEPMTQQQLLEGPPLNQLPQQQLREIKLEPKPEPQVNQAPQPMLNFVNDSAIPTKRPKLEEPLAQNNSFEALPPKQEPHSLFPPPTSTENRRSTTPKDAKPSTSKAPMEPIVPDPKIFDANELRNHLMPVWKRLYESEPECIPFRLPVDPKALNIPDYFDVVKNPIDLQTIKENLDQGKYKNPWEFCDHMWLMFENAWLYNRKNTKVHKWCTRMSEIYIEEINPAMRQLGYCCGQKLSFTPLVQFCFGITQNAAACVIARDQQYFMYESSSTGFGVTVAERYIYCEKCFGALPEKGINLNENTTDPPNWIPKSMFQKMKNDQIDMEPFENCKICDRKWHRICAMHSNKVNAEGFICEQCRTEKNRPRPENKFTARKLPHCHLSRFIEDRVNGFLRQKIADNDPEVEVVIRVLCSSDKEVEVKPGMMKKYGSEGYPDRFPYRSKAVFAFEMLKDPDTGVSQEVCFFGLYVQEYGTSCSQPNQRRVYIAYLDSVHYFQPRHLRTSIYYEILLGYLQYVKKLGYTMAHIWACPPSEGDDYIFHCHPPEQKIPKPKRLQDWYKTMLNNGNDEGTVYSYKDIFSQAKDDALDTPMKLPYFEGDYWPRIIDECIVSAEKDEEIDRRKQEDNANISDDDTFQTDDGMPVKKQPPKTSNSKKKNNLKKSSQNSKKKGASNTGNPVIDRLFQQLEKHRDVFFTIKLFSPHDEQIVLSQKPKIEDPDPLISCELMDTRDNFLAKSREEHWEFSQLRRSKWSTLNFCYTLHTQEQDKGLSYTCNVCEQAASYHCNTCEDFDLCDACKQKNPHHHQMERLLVEDQKSADASAASRNDSVKKCITSLVHACTCRDANCRRGTCHKMKKVISHTKQCKRRQAAGANCAVCKQLIALCCYHAKHCNQTKCQVPFCLQIRQKLQEQKRSQNRQAERMMQRRMMKLQKGAMNGGAPSGSAAPSFSQQSSTSMDGMATPQQNNWVSGPAVIAMGQTQFSQQSMSMANNQTGMMMPPNPQMRMNGPSNFNQMQNPMPNHMINSPPLNSVQPHQVGGANANYQMGATSHMQNQMPSNQINMIAPGMHSSSPMPQQQQHLMQTSQQQINAPPYIRSGQMQQQQPGMSPIGHQQMGQGKFVSPPQQQTPRFQQPMQSNQREQPYGGGIGQQQQMRPNDVTLIMTRFKEAKTNEEREAILADLKKTPHLFNAFLKITKALPHQRQEFTQEMGTQQQLRHQQQFMQSAGHYQGNPGGMMTQSQQHNGTQFNSPPPQHQWMQPQSNSHQAQTPSQRNPT